MKKVYKSITGIVYTFPVIVSDTKVWVECNLEYETADEKIQKAIENHTNFTSGNIATAITKVEEPIEEIILELKSFPEVTTINDAVALLRGEPYRVNHMKLKSPDKVLEQAKLNLVDFPNWTI